MLGGTKFVKACQTWRSLMAGGEPGCQEQGEGRAGVGRPLTPSDRLALPPRRSTAKRCRKHKCWCVSLTSAKTIWHSDMRDLSLRLISLLIIVLRSFENIANSLCKANRPPLSSNYIPYSDQRLPILHPYC